MSVTDLAPAPTRQPTASPKITGRVATALRYMIEEGLNYQDAATRVGMHVRQMRKAIEKPHVLNYLKRQRQVFRAAISASNDLRLAEIRDHGHNENARVQAIKALERLEDEQHHRLSNPFSSSPGLVIVVNGGNVSASHALPNAAVTERDRQQAIDATEE